MNKRNRAVMRAMAECIDLQSERITELEGIVSESGKVQWNKCCDEMINRTLLGPAAVGKSYAVLDMVFEEARHRASSAIRHINRGSYEIAKQLLIPLSQGIYHDVKDDS